MGILIGIAGAYFLASAWAAGEGGTRASVNWCRNGFGCVVRAGNCRLGARYSGALSNGLRCRSNVRPPDSLVADPGDFPVHSQTRANGELHGLAVEDRQHPRHAEADRARLLIRIGLKYRATGAKQF